jgi:hypothetical protein
MSFHASYMKLEVTESRYSALLMADISLRMTWLLNFLVFYMIILCINMKFEVLKAVNTKTAVLCNVTLCSLI